MWYNKVKIREADNPFKTAEREKYIMMTIFAIIFGTVLCAVIAALILFVLYCLAGVVLAIID